MAVWSTGHDSMQPRIQSGVSFTRVGRASSPEVSYTNGNVCFDLSHERPELGGSSYAIARGV